MKSYIQGKVINCTYGVFYRKDDKGNFKFKPYLTKERGIEYETLKRGNGDDFIVDGSIGKNFENFTFGWRINLSENEEVEVSKKIYRADLNAYMIHTDKVIKENEFNKEESEAELKTLLAEYNEQKISADEKLKKYCDLHKLIPSETDYDELKNIVYPNCLTQVVISNNPTISLYDNF